MCMNVENQMQCKCLIVLCTFTHSFCTLKLVQQSLWYCF